MSISNEQKARILRLHLAEGWGVNTVADQLGIHHTTVERVLARAGPPRAERTRRPSKLDPWLPFMIETLEQYPTLTAQRLYRMCVNRGHQGGASLFRARVAELRPRPTPEAHLRLRTLPGEQARVDWGHFGKVTIGRAERPLMAFVMVLSYSRRLFLRFYLNQRMEGFLHGHRSAFEYQGRVPRVLLYDNLKSAVLDRQGDAIRFHPTLLELSTWYRFEPRPVAPARGNEKGRVERAIRYVRDNFFAARSLHLSGAVVAEVAANPGIHTRELHERVPELSTKITVGSGKWTSEVPVGSRLLVCLAMQLRIARAATSGSWRTSQYGWCQAPDVQRPSVEEGRLWLVQRYLDRFGPVTTADIRWWTGLTAAQVRKALDALDVEAVAVDDGEAWILPGQLLPEALGVCLLPELDPTPMGYKERSWFLGNHGGVLFDRNGNVGPTIWVDGRIVGGWAVDGEGEVHTWLLERVSEARQDEVERRARALQEWLNGVPVKPRLRTPLERELSG